MARSYGRPDLVWERAMRATAAASVGSVAGMARSHGLADGVAGMARSHNWQEG